MRLAESARYTTYILIEMIAGKILPRFLTEGTAVLTCNLQTLQDIQRISKYVERYTLYILVKRIAGLIWPEFPRVETERLTCNLENLQDIQHIS